MYSKTTNKINNTYLSITNKRKHLTNYDNNIYNNTKIYNNKKINNLVYNNDAYHQHIKKFIDNTYHNYSNIIQQTQSFTSNIKKYIYQTIKNIIIIYLSLRPLIIYNKNIIQH
jgi:hypothetical protein